MPTLTPRTEEVWRLLWQRASNRDIAARLCVSEGHARNLVHTTLRRLGASSRADAAAMYARVRAEQAAVLRERDARAVDVLARTVAAVDAVLDDVEARCADLRRALDYPRRVAEGRRVG